MFLHPAKTSKPTQIPCSARLVILVSAGCYPPSDDTGYKVVAFIFLVALKGFRKVIKKTFDLNKSDVVVEDIPLVYHPAQQVEPTRMNN